MTTSPSPERAMGSRSPIKPPRPRGAERPAPASDGKSASVMATLQQLASFAAPVTVITSVLYYFGYVRRETFCAHFGLDLVTAGYDTTDYIIPSFETVFRPFTKLLAAAGIAVAVHLVLTPLTKRSRRWRHGTAGALGAIAIVLLAFGVSGMREAELGPQLAAPVALGSGACILEYAITVGRPGAGETETPFWEAAAATRRLRRALLVPLLLVALFWSTADLAHQGGEADAQSVENALHADVQVVVYSKPKLFLMGHGIVSVALAPSTSSYQFRYSGLRLLRHTRDRWLLLPAGWRPGAQQPVIILADTPTDIRVELMR
jgi:hypothetical protein